MFFNSRSANGCWGDYLKEKRGQKWKLRKQILKEQGKSSDS